jgi:hypothetical protein
VEPLITLLESDDSGVKSRAIESLGDIGDERAIGPLGFSLNDESEQVRQLAQTALEKIENPKVKTPSSGLYGQDPAFNITEEWGMEFVDMDIENTSMPAISYPYYAIYGKRSNFYIEDERREYLDKLRIIGNASMTEIEKYVQPQGPVYSYEYSYNGYISVGMATDSGVNESLMNEIYDIFDQHAQEIGIENIPVIFEYGNNEIAGDVDNEPDSRKACGFTVFLLVIVITLIYGTSHK